MSQMRRLLIVTGSYYPAILADTHRARLLATELRHFDWEVEVLAAGTEFQREDAIETDAAVFFDPAVPVHFAAPRGQTLFRILKMRSIGWRAFWPIYEAGKKLLAKQRFDLVYITTAQFNLFCLGRLWQRRFGTPYVLDFHDPWVRRVHKVVTTKHTLKFRIAGWLTRLLEKFAVLRAAGVVAVSPTYIEQLQSRYPGALCLTKSRAAVIPFAASERDLEAARASANRVKIDIAYVGAGGEIMEKSWRAILKALATLHSSEASTFERIRFGFFGTEAFWQEGDRKFLEEIAGEYGLRHLVEEHAPRISYRRAMEIIRLSGGLVVLGVDDPAYMPSKLFLYALTGKPLLACLHQHSQANCYFKELPGLGHLIRFNGQKDDAGNAHTVRLFLQEVMVRQTFDRHDLLADYLSPASARRHAHFFERLLSA
jgi:glycosyltransferase involved in cell wall biosynthesis